MEGQTLRVLLIEDNPGDARLIQEALREERPGRAGGPAFELLTSSRVSEGVKCLREQVVDVVLLDLSLPDAHGLDTLFQVQAAAPEMPVVVLTGIDDEDLACAAVREGAQDYMVKNHTDGVLLARALRYAVERQEMRAALRRLSLTDELTGLYNRRGFLTLAEQQLRFAHRTNQDLLFIFVDLDGLKRINDTYGHPEGDRALVAMAQVLRETFRSSDIVSRIGGDEFAILAIDAYEGSSDIIAAALQENMSRYDSSHNLDYKLSASLGAVRVDPENTRSVEDILAQADQELYAQKRIKKERVAKQSSKVPN